MCPLSGDQVFNQYAADPIFAAAVDALFESARPHVQRFADEHELELEAWPHDLPIWMLRWEEDGVTNSIRIMAGTDRGGKMPRLGVVVLVYQDLPSSGLRLVQDRGYAVGEIGRDDLQPGSRKVTDLLETALSAAEAISESQNSSDSARSA